MHCLSVRIITLQLRHWTYMYHVERQFAMNRLVFTRCRSLTIAFKESISLYYKNLINLASRQYYVFTIVSCSGWMFGHLLAELMHNKENMKTTWLLKLPPPKIQYPSILINRDTPDGTISIFRASIQKVTAKKKMSNLCGARSLHRKVQRGLHQLSFLGN